MKAVLALCITEPRLALLEVSEDPEAIRSAARSMLRDLPAGEDDFERARVATLQQLAVGGS